MEKRPEHQKRGIGRRMTALVIAILAVGALLGTTASCSSFDCPVQTKVRTIYSIRNAAQKADTLRDTLTVATRLLSRKDSLILNTTSHVVQFSLHVGYANPEDTLFFSFRNGTFRAIDTVWVKKENLPHFESVDCNATFFHNITAVRCTHHAIDSITINNPSVTYDTNAEHFYLYIKKHN